MQAITLTKNDEKNHTDQINQTSGINYKIFNGRNHDHCEDEEDYDYDYDIDDSTDDYDRNSDSDRDTNDNIQRCKWERHISYEETSCNVKHVDETSKINEMDCENHGMSGYNHNSHETNLHNNSNSKEKMSCCGKYEKCRKNCVRK